MNRLRVPPFLWGALVLLLLGVSSAPAEVKLRIYLQDGSLQAGNLIAENTDSFVILGKDGRVEIPKKNIMFVNGKTLKQWSDRPDKLFQTEIIPSDIPNPAYVNDKAALPAPPAAKKPPVVPAVTPLAKVAPPVVPPAPTATPAETAKAEAAAQPTPVSQAKPSTAEVRRKRKPRHERVTTAAVSNDVSVDRPVAPLAETALAAEAKRPTSRLLAMRAAKGAVHRQHGFALLAEGQTGAAMGELMIARLLEPDNGDTNLALARIDRGYGLNEAALKYLDHWTLRKSDAATAERAAINHDLADAARRQTYWQIGGGLGAFSWLPFVLLYRRVRRRRAARRAAETPVEPDVETTGAEPAVAPIAATADWVEQAEKVFEPPKVEPQRLPEKWPEPPAPEPVAPAAIEPPTPLPAPAAEEPPVAEPVQPPIPTPEPEPEAEPIVPARLNPQEILAMARSVENALVRGNAAAAAGRPDEARRYYRTALALNADCATAHLGLGYLAFAEEKWDTSLLHYKKALEISASADAHYGIARVLLEINRVEDAVPELRATLSLDPTYDDARDALTAIGKPA